MRKTLIFVLIALVMTFTASAVSACKEDKGTVRLIAVSDDPETEIEVVVDGERHTEILLEGINVLTYKSEEPETFRTIEYGDTTKPKMDKGEKAWFAYTFVKKPGESVGE